jgi:hypothetical protein
MRGKMARSDPRPSVRVTRGAGSGQHLASVLQKGRENANIDAGLGFIWRISEYIHPSSLFTYQRGTWTCALVYQKIISRHRA